jgi:cobalt-zinc-cadmium efflux system membrane fusion protein
MNKSILITLAALSMIAACAREADDVGDEHDMHAAAAEVPRGPHGGRLLTSDSFSIELAIFEAGVPPEFRVWATQNGKAVNPADVDLSVELTRLGGVVHRVAFAPQADYLRGNREILEPHSFDVRVVANHQGTAHTWAFASYEGRTTIPAEIAKTAGIEIQSAGAGSLRETVALYGTIAADPTRVRDVKARFAGTIQSASRRIGDKVRAGETLATVESNESLRSYAVTAPIAGVVTARHAESGEQTGDGTLFEIADFTRVVADFTVFPRDRGRLRAGQTIRVTSEGGAPADGAIDYITPSGDRSSQSVTARVSLENGEARWTPGQFVEGHVTLGETPVALAVPLSALQTFRDFTVVFAQVGDTYEVRMLELGRRDAERAEVLGGLEPGTTIVTQNSYLIKADIEKSGASHDH